MPPRARSRSRSRGPAVASSQAEGGTRSAPRTPRASSVNARPPREVPLPMAEHGNPQLLASRVKATPVKLQELLLENGVKIIICRVKLPTPKNVSGHLIRRLDTDAVSASSMYRVAFPTASETDEHAEMAWVDRQHDTAAAGHEDEAHRLTGTWIPTKDAYALAVDYNLSHLVGELLSYTQEDDHSADATPPKQTTSLTAPSSAHPPATTTPVRQSKRQRLKSPESNLKPTVTVSQTLRSDPATGEILETTQVTVDGAPSAAEEGLIGSDATAEAAVADAKALVESLKATGTLPSVDSSLDLNGTGKKRTRDIVDAEEAIFSVVPAAKREPAARGVMGRLFGRKRQAQAQLAVQDQQLVLRDPEQIAPANRRLIALAGVLVAGAATAAAPYIFG